MSWWVLPLLVGSLSLELAGPAVDLSAEARDELCRRVASAIERRTGQPVTIGPSSKSETDDHVTLAVDVGTTRIQLVAERRRGDQVIGRHTVVGPQQPAEWDERADTIASALFEASAKETTNVGTTPDTFDARPERPMNWIPPAMLGASVIAAGVGIAFGVSSLDAQSVLDSRVVFDDELEEIGSRAADHRNVAVSLLAAATLSAGIAVFLLLVD